MADSNSSSFIKKLIITKVLLIAAVAVAVVLLRPLLAVQRTATVDLNDIAGGVVGVADQK